MAPGDLDLSTHAGQCAHAEQAAGDALRSYLQREAASAARQLALPHTGTDSDSFRRAGLNETARLAAALLSALDAAGA